MIVLLSKHIVCYFVAVKIRKNMKKYTQKKENNIKLCRVKYNFGLQEIHKKIAWSAHNPIDLKKTHLFNHLSSHSTQQSSTILSQS